MVTAEAPAREPILLTMKAAADRLSISRSKAYELALDGRLPGVIRVGQSLRVSRAKLDAWIDQAASEVPATA